MLLNQILNQPTNKGLQKILDQGKYQENHIGELRKKQNEKVKASLVVSARDLNDLFNKKEDNYLRKYPDATPLDFINKELENARNLETLGRKMRLEREYFYSIKKHIEYLKQCKKMELDNPSTQDDAFAIHSEHSATFVVTLILQLAQNGAINLESYSHMARVIKKYFRCNGSDEIKSAESLISKIRNNDRSTEKTLEKVRYVLSKNSDFYT